MGLIKNLEEKIEQFYENTKLGILTKKSFEVIEKLEKENVDENYFRKEIIERLKKDEMSIDDFKEQYIKNCYLYVNLNGFLGLPFNTIDGILGKFVNSILSEGLFTKRFCKPLEKFISLNSENERYVFVVTSDWDKNYPPHRLGTSLLKIK